MFREGCQPNLIRSKIGVTNPSYSIILELIPLKCYADFTNKYTTKENNMPETRPNILLITSDQQHWNTLGCLNPEIQTPHLDTLAQQGTLFNRAYCPNPTCTPTRASIITGKYPSQHGAWSLGTKLSEAEHTVGEDFTEAGYRTALVGKAHFQPLHGTEEFPSLESYPILQDLDFWRSFNEPFYGFEHVELARNHADEAHVGQHYALSGWKRRVAQIGRDYFAPPTGNARGQRQKVADSRGIPLRYMDCGTHQWTHGSVSAERRKLLPLGKFFRSSPEISCARTVGYNV